MKHTKIFGSLLFFGFLLSCSTGDVSTTDERELLAKKNVEQELTMQEIQLLVRLQRPSNRIDMEEALQMAKEFTVAFRKSDSIDSLNNNGDFLLAPYQRNNSKKRTVLSKEELSAASINVKNISVFLSENVLRNLNTKAKKGISIPDTLAYVFDFNEGYAIVSADARIGESVLGIVEKGSFDRQTDNPGMALYLNMLDAYLIHSITEAERQKDSLLSSIHSKLGVSNLNVKDINNILSTGKIWSDYYVWDCPPSAAICTETFGPLIPVEWGQHWPFNDSIKNANECPVVNNINGKHNPGGRKPAGCVATATAQVMAYWQHPSVNALTGINVTWAALNNFKTKYDFYSFAEASHKASIAKIFKKIGEEVSMDYIIAGCGGSYADSKNAMKYLRSLGYPIHESLGDWNYRVIRTALNEYIPVPIYIIGCEEVGVLGCHAWLIDGWKEIYKRENTYISEKQYLHHNFGWDDDKDNSIYLLTNIITQTLESDVKHRFRVKINPIYGP